MQFGNFEIHFLSDGLFKLDIGAMFGIVPKPLWEKERQSDARNRMQLTLTVPLIRAGSHNIILDCGIGRKWNAKQRDIYDVQEHPNLLDSLVSVGLKPADITIVIHSHLHHDHTGWNTQLNAKGEPEPTFVNARHIVQKLELESARHPNEIQRGTYLRANVEPIRAGGGWDPFDDNREIVPGITVFHTGGHTAGHSAVSINSGGQKAMFLADLFPTTTHRHLPWITAYDEYPMETLEAKRRLFRECVEHNALVLLNHDPNACAVRLQAAGEKFEAIKEC
ncbi:MAG: MBL fold metallo-hydrolase [Planctomycetota bacterium]|nr:MBL fold metallo-hydrolase [Planctomycetota bacterium]